MVSELNPKYTPITGTAKIATLMNPVTANRMSAALDCLSMIEKITRNNTTLIASVWRDVMIQSTLKQY